MSDQPTLLPHWNEQDRLKAVESYHILDTPREEEFDDIVKLAAQVCHVPIALISFVTSGRQWFKAVIGHRMDQLIQDVLVFSRVGMESVELKIVDADTLIREIIHSYPNLHADNVHISIRSPLPPVKANEALLTQCFSNLLENGIKFAKKGTKPNLKVWSESSDDRIKLFFEDDGIGISDDHLERIFEIFHRIKRDTEGTGIGLAIVRKAVTKMGGTLGVRSELGKGSVFWLDLQTV